MSRDDRDERPIREASLRAADHRASGPRSVSSHRAVPSDRFHAREFLSQLYKLAARDADLLQDPDRISDRWLAASEIAEFGLNDPDIGEQAALVAAAAPQVDGRVFSTLRRVARASANAEALQAAYSRDATQSRAPEDRLMARIGEVLLALRNGADVKEQAGILGRLASEAQNTESELAALWRSISEDALVAFGKPDLATEIRVGRWEPWQNDASVTPEDRAALALTTAALAEHAGLAESDILSWYNTAFELDPSLVAARPIFRWAWKQGQYRILAQMLESIAERSDEADERASAYYQLGMLRAHIENDIEKGLAALSQSAATGMASGLGASAFLSLARSSHGSAVPDEVVDALTARLEFAASGMESADLLTQMAERFDAELQFPDVAEEMATAALVECPHWTPALRLLGHIYSRDGHWEKLVDLHARQLVVERDPDEIRKLHERIAEVAHEQLHKIPFAETHLVEALRHGWRAPTAQRLATIYRELGRWEEFFQLQVRAAMEAPVRGEKLRLLEEAAEVAEEHLHDVERSISAWSQALEVDPGYSTALAALERIFVKYHRWEELLRLCEHELALVGQHNDSARLTLLVRCAAISRDRLANHHASEDFYRRALRIDPLYDDALRGLGSILKEQGRWHDLIAMTEQEHEGALSPERRAKCLRQIGELYVRQLNDLEAGLGAYRRLGALGAEWHEEALLWLERLYEATGDDRRLLQVMRGRRELAKDESGQAKLSFRIAELLEWRSRKYPEALQEYVAALPELSVASEVVAAMERCLVLGEVSASDASDALVSLTDYLPSLPPETCRAALDLLVAQARKAGDDEAAEALLLGIRERWGDDRLVAEQLALRALQQKDWSAAEEFRSTAVKGPIDAMRTVWRDLDGEGLVDDEQFDAVGDGWLSQWTRREMGETGTYNGADDRELLMLIQRSEISLGELVEPENTWISRSLAIFAARTLHDPQGLQAGIEALAKQAHEPLLQMRIWLDAAGEGVISPELRRTWLRRAAETGNFGHPMREDVYRALHTTGDEEGLVIALRNHVESGVPQEDELAQLALRLGRALEGHGRRDEAVAALRLATVHSPANATIALEKSRVEALAGDLHEARTTLEAVLAAGCDDSHKLDIYLRLADLHMLDGGDRQRLLQALEEAFVLSKRAPELGLRLSETHLLHGDAERGASLLSSLLQPEIIEDELRYWSLLGRTYALRLQKTEKAEALLWRCFDAFPERNELLNQIEEVASRTGRTAQYAQMLRARLESEDLAISTARRSALWMTLGTFQLDTLSRPEEAEHSFKAAVDAGANRGQAQLQRARAVSMQQGRAIDAATLIVDAVNSKDFDVRNLPDVVTELDRLYVEGQDTSRLRTVRQIRKMFGHNTPEVGLAERRDVDAPLDQEAFFQEIGAKLLSARERFVLGECSALALRVFGKKFEALQKIEQTRYRMENYGYFDQHLRAACALLQVEVPRLTVAVNGVSVMTFDGQNYYVPASRIVDGQPAAARYWAGWIAASVASKLGVYSQLKDDDIRQLLSAIAHRAGHGDTDPKQLGLVDEIGGMLNLSARRTAETAYRAAPEVFASAGEGRATAIRAIADRFAAAFSDHPGVAIYEAARASGSSSQSELLVASDLRNTPRVKMLVRFLLSEHYLRVRETLGIGPRRAG